MDFASLIDAQAAAIVVGGTTVATFLRCGLTDCRHALTALNGLWQRRFNARRVRAELALQVQDIQKDGLLRANPHHFGDREFDEATDALIGSRSLSALIAAHESHKLRRKEASDGAMRTLSQAVELAPIFGLAGTLVSLSQLPTDGAGVAFAGAISLAVLTTLYGLLLANLILAPLLRVVERAAHAEEKERQSIVDWLTLQLEPVLPPQKPTLVAETV